MSKPTFLEEAGVALIIALAGILIHGAIGWVLPGGTALRLLASGLGLAYVLYLLGRSRERTGRVTTLALWLTVTGLLWAISLPLSLYISVQLAMIWMTRSLYFHQGLFAALMDLGLSGLSLIGALGAYLHTGSLFLSLWCLFLIQALFVYIPPLPQPGSQNTGSDQDRFLRAHEAATAAVQRLSSNH